MKVANLKEVLQHLQAKVMHLRLCQEDFRELSLGHKQSFKKQLQELNNTVVLLSKMLGV